MLKHPSVSPGTVLKVAVKAMNDNIEENELVHSPLVFGIPPRFPIIGTDRPSQKGRMEALATTHAEIEINRC